MQTVNVNHETLLPILVYGSLRRGMSNEQVAYSNGGIFAGNVTLSGFEMWAPSHKCYPYVSPGGSGSIKCDIILPPSEENQARAMMRALDRLEGYVHGRPNNHYERVCVSFSRDGESQLAWMYIVEKESLRKPSSMELVPGGDWSAYHGERFPN